MSSGWAPRATTDRTPDNSRLSMRDPRSYAYGLRRRCDDAWTRRRRVLHRTPQHPGSRTATAQLFDFCPVLECVDRAPEAGIPLGHQLPERIEPVECVRHDVLALAER